jgi:Domain of unknown function (DUF1905)/Bacteriocin-protection, YdeI or OmpD-Associated
MSPLLASPGELPVVGKAKSPQASFTFTATVGRTWRLYSVDVPRSVSRALGGAGKIAVIFTLDGSPPRKTTLTPRAGGGHRLHVHGESRRAVGAKEGDRVTIVLRPDLGPAGTAPPPDLADALRELDVLDAFRAMGPAVQRELVAYIENARREETRRKYVARVVERACAERERRLDRDARRR